MNNFEKAQAAKILSMYSNAEEILNDIEKAQPVGTINKYGKQKQADGSWKYVGKGGNVKRPEKASSPAKPSTRGVSTKGGSGETVGQAYKVPSGLTHDPAKLRGQSVTVTDITDGGRTIHVKTPNGKTGKYSDGVLTPLSSKEKKVFDQLKKDSKKKIESGSNKKDSSEPEKMTEDQTSFGAQYLINAGSSSHPSWSLWKTLSNGSVRFSLTYGDARAISSAMGLPEKYFIENPKELDKLKKRAKEVIAKNNLKNEDYDKATILAEKKAGAKWDNMTSREKMDAESQLREEAGKSSHEWRKKNIKESKMKKAEAFEILGISQELELG